MEVQHSQTDLRLRIFKRPRNQISGRYELLRMEDPISIITSLILFLTRYDCDVLDLTLTQFTILKTAYAG